MQKLCQAGAEVRQDQARCENPNRHIKKPNQNPKLTLMPINPAPCSKRAGEPFRNLAEGPAAVVFSHRLVGAHKVPAAPLFSQKNALHIGEVYMSNMHAWRLAINSLMYALMNCSETRVPYHGWFCRIRIATDRNFAGAQFK